MVVDIAENPPPFSFPFTFISIYPSRLSDVFVFIAFFKNASSSPQPLNTDVLSGSGLGLRPSPLIISSNFRDFDIHIDAPFQGT